MKTKTIVWMFEKKNINKMTIDLLLRSLKLVMVKVRFFITEILVTNLVRQQKKKGHKTDF